MVWMMQVWMWRGPPYSLWNLRRLREGGFCSVMAAKLLCGKDCQSCLHSLKDLDLARSSAQETVECRMGGSGERLPWQGSLLPCCLQSHCDLGLVMCRARLGSKAPAWARLETAWACDKDE